MFISWSHVAPLLQGTFGFVPRLGRVLARVAVQVRFTTAKPLWATMELTAEASFLLGMNLAHLRSARFGGSSSRNAVRVRVHERSLLPCGLAPRNVDSCYRRILAGKNGLRRWCVEDLLRVSVADFCSLTVTGVSAVMTHNIMVCWRLQPT